jgi:hypothetical protein
MSFASFATAALLSTAAAAGTATQVTEQRNCCARSGSPQSQNTSSDHAQRADERPADQGMASCHPFVATPTDGVNWGP